METNQLHMTRGENMDIISDTKVKARKSHVCDYCGLEIPKGDVYHRVVYKCGGEVYTWESHLCCDELVKKLHMYDYTCDEGVTEQSFRDHIWDYAREHEKIKVVTWKQALEFTLEREGVRYESILDQRM